MSWFTSACRDLREKHKQYDNSTVTGCEQEVRQIRSNCCRLKRQLIVIPRKLVRNYWLSSRSSENIDNNGGSNRAKMCWHCAHFLTRNFTILCQLGLSNCSVDFCLFLIKFYFTFALPPRLYILCSCFLPWFEISTNSRYSLQTACTQGKQSQFLEDPSVCVCVFLCLCKRASLIQ